MLFMSYTKTNLRCEYIMVKYRNTQLLRMCIVLTQCAFPQIIEEKTMNYSIYL